MSKFVIPKNTDFTFTFLLNKKDSFDPQDLTNVSSSIFTVFEESDQSVIFTALCVVTDPVGGLFSCSMDSSVTDLLEIRRANPEDGYFLRVKYNATIAVEFSDGTAPASVFIRDVLVSPSGV